jgi:hypothetical protein
VLSGGMLVTAPVSSGPVVVEKLGELFDVLLLRVVGGVGGVEVSGGTVLLPVGFVVLPENMLDDVVVTGGSEVVDEVIPVPGPVTPPVMLVDELEGGFGVPVPVLPESVDERVEFVIGVCPGSLLVDVGGGGGGSVTVAEVPVATPVPGPVMPSDELGLNVVVALDDGSRMLERPEPMPLKRELSGLGGSDVLELVVTIPVGANRISDVLDVGTGGSTEVDGSC